MKITVKNLANEDVKEIEVPEEIFSYPMKEHLVHTAVRAVLAAARRGTHKTKTRAEVAGTGRKLWRQKGTGRARMGAVRSPLWRKGGTVHGPQPRSYKMKLSAREKRNALKSALAQKLADSGILVLESLELESHKTKALRSCLLGLGVERKALLVDSRDNDRLTLAARNNPLLKTVDALGVNVYDVVDRDHVVLSETALERLVEVLSK
jgi:large subunit ribosomal protein L4